MYPLRRMLLAAVLSCLLPLGVASAQTSMPVEGEAADRELVVRFARTYGMVQAALNSRDDQTQALVEPEDLDEPLRGEVRAIMERNGIDRATWRGMLARMDDDAELRQRIESLAVPYQTQ